MNINEAYQHLKPLITTTKSTLGLRTAQDMETQALDSKDFPVAWVWAAGAYVIENNKPKFSEMISKAAEAYLADITKRGNVSSMHQDQADALRVLAENANLAYELVFSNLPEGSSKLGLEDSARMLFAKSIIVNRIPVQGGIEAVIECTKRAIVIEDQGFMVRLTAGPLIFQVYDLELPDGKSQFENGLNLIKIMSGKSNLPTFLADGIHKQPGNDIGWYLTKI